MKLTGSLSGINLTSHHFYVNATSGGVGDGGRAPEGGGENPTLYLYVGTDNLNGRKNADGNYYNITFPDDFIGQGGWNPDAASATIDMLDSDGIIYINVQAAANIGSNSTITGVSESSQQHDNVAPSFTLNYNWWSEADAVKNLRLGINNWGYIFGGGGWGGYGATIKWPSTGHGGGGGAGGGIHQTQASGKPLRNTMTDRIDTHPGLGGKSAKVYWGETGTSANGAEGESVQPWEGGAKGAGDSAAEGTTRTIQKGCRGGAVFRVKNSHAAPDVELQIVNYTTGWIHSGGGGGHGGSQSTSVYVGTDGADSATDASPLFGGGILCPWWSALL